MATAARFLPQPLHFREASLVETLVRLRDPQARFAWTVEQARRRPPLPDALRTDVYRVEGCQVRLWWIPEWRDGRGWFQTDSDALTLRAMSGLLCDLASGATAEELRSWQPEFLERLGLLRQLAESRRATVWRVAEKIRTFGEQATRAT